MFGKIAVTRLGWPTAMILGWLAGIVAVGPFIAQGFHWPGFLAAWPAWGYGLGGALGAVLLTRALTQGPASAVLPMSELWLVVSVALSVLFLGEQLTWRRVLGLALVIAGAVVLARE
jgi:uncharacterized membrane protein